VDLADVRIRLVPRLEPRDCPAMTNCRWTQHGQTRVFQGAEIEVTRDLSRPLFDSVVAHELMHVWVSQNVGELPDKRSEEGACQMVAHMVLEKYRHSPRAAYLEKKIELNKDPIYGAGYRRAQAHRRHDDPGSVLELLRRGKKL
jgi:hypothetical protein